MNKIVEIKFGSWLYGTNTPTSDLDFKGIYLPTAREIVLGNYKKTIAKVRSKKERERNTKDDVDYEYFSLDRYFELLAEGQTVALDVLFTPNDFYVHGCDQASGLIHPIMAEIFWHRDKILTKNVAAFVGYARQQASRYGIKGSRMDALKRTNSALELCAAEYGTNTKLLEAQANILRLVEECQALISLEKMPLVEIVYLKGPKGEMDAPHLKVNGRAIPFHAKIKYALEVVGKMLAEYGKRAHKAHLAGGCDWKALSHAVRVNSEAKELLETGYITFPRPDRELLLKIKTGEMPYEQVAEIIEQGVANLYVSQTKSTLREKPDQEWIDDFIYYTYSEIVKGNP